MPIGESYMKLLIVDDEELTRTGLVSSIDWESLGITEILQADDGMNGLEMARLHKPEIILCDVRMPRMTGIAMLERLEKILPDCIPIFMSGYSDKEYLKAAIKLKAVNYIEKPLNPEEIREAILEAQSLYKQKLRSHRGEALHSLETSTRLALKLTVPSTSSNQEIVDLCLELGNPELLDSGINFTSIIVKLNNTAESSSAVLEDIHREIARFLAHYHLKCLFAEKRVQYLVYHIYGSNPISPTTLSAVGSYISRQYSTCGKHMIAAGNTVTDISKVYQSYASAVILLQNCFFFPAETFLTEDIVNQQPPKPPLPGTLQSPESTFSKYLLSGEEEPCGQFLEELFGYYNGNLTFMPNQIRNLYYQLFSILSAARKKNQVESGFHEKQDLIVDTLDNAFTYEELHESLKEKTAQYFEDAKNSQPENSTIFMIKDYISRNYMNDTLSVKDISSHVYLSASYVCTFFKSETGQTLNQYLTEYRMEKAKQLLSDPRYKISEISSKVGYTDGNYFGKSFKKYSGFSPSEYREKMS